MRIENWDKTFERSPSMGGNEMTPYVEWTNRQTGEKIIILRGYVPVLWPGDTHILQDSSLRMPGTVIICFSSLPGQQWDSRRVLCYDVTLDEAKEKAVEYMRNPLAVPFVSMTPKAPSKSAEPKSGVVNVDWFV